MASRGSATVNNDDQRRTTFANSVRKLRSRVALAESIASSPQTALREASPTKTETHH
jgi:hypothetical protein